MFKKLRNNFIILNMSIISLMMIAAFAAIYTIIYTNTQNENRAKLERLLPVATLSIARDDMTLAAGTHVTAGAVPMDYTLSFRVIADENGNSLLTTTFVDLPDNVSETAVKLAVSSERDSSIVTTGGKQWMFRSNKVGDLGFWERRGLIGGYEYVTYKDCLQISFLDVTDSQNLLTRLLVLFSTIGFCMLFVIFGVSVFFARRSVAPVEIAYEKQRQFITDASHELKTPIAAISANADALLINKHETIERQEKWIEYIKAENDRMGKLVADLLYLAKTDDAELNFERLPFNISAVVSEAVLSSEAVAYERGLTVNQNIEPGIIAYGDSCKAAQVVKILLDNAIKYSHCAGQIDIRLSSAKNNTAFSIRNTGMGIPPKDLPKIFDRFYRADPSRTNDGSYGLGLSIAKTIIDNMGGKIYACSEEGKYAEFHFSLPRISHQSKI